MFLRLFFLPLLLLAIASLAEADGGNIHITGNLTAQSCTVDGATDFTLSLGTVDRADLPSVGSTANQVGLNIPLSCISGTKVIIQIDGTSVSDNNTVMVNTGTAEGVGTQLLEPNNNNRPVPLGRSWTIIENSQTSEVITLGARFYRTGDVVPGTVNATATYTLSYE